VRKYTAISGSVSPSGQTNELQLSTKRRKRDENGLVKDLGKMVAGPGVAGIIEGEPRLDLGGGGELPS